MRLQKLIILGLAITLVAGAGVAIWRHHPSKSPLPTPERANAERTYLEGTHYDASRGALLTFSSSDGMNFEKWTITCGSPEGARKEMQAALQRALRIDSREPVLDVFRNQIGEEVVAVFPTNDRDYGAASLFHVDRSQYLIQVRAGSLANLLTYKDDFKH